MACFITSHFFIFPFSSVNRSKHRIGTMGLLHSVTCYQMVSAPEGRSPLLRQTTSAIQAMATLICITPQHLQCLSLRSSSWCYFHLLPRDKDTREGQIQTLLDHTCDEKMATWKPRKNLYWVRSPVPKTNKLINK